MTNEAPIVVVPYEAAWPHQFDQERRELERVLENWLIGPIEHVGSTAIPGLAAKPVIDIMAGVAGLEASRPAIAVLTDAGYCYSPYRSDLEHWLWKPSPALRTHHLHLVPYGSAAWNDRLAFRDYMSSHGGIDSIAKHTPTQKRRSLRRSYRRCATEVAPYRRRF